MAFWGAKIKPKKPFLINEDELDGRRLHITQATLGLLPETDDNPQRSVVKCRTGESSAVFMCSLKPGLQESIPLNLYFDGPAIFFVTGPAAVHLCGYLEDMSEDLEDDEDMSDDSMDEDFVVDDDEEVEDDDEDDEDVMRAPVIKAHNVRIEEITDDGEKGNERLAIEAAKPEEKKQNEETSEDEDGFPTKRKNSSDDTPNKKSKTSDAPATPATPAENQSGKKKKRKAKKQEEEGDQPAEEPKQTEKSPASKGKSKSDKKRFANGLEIENVKMGKPDGKQAKIGKKVSIQYIGKLVKTGKIFDSTVGKKPFHFRLGVNEVIRGFDIGVAGMRVGDKRRVTIPPSMGYGDKSVGPIPPGSWLCFDIELVDVK